MPRTLLIILAVLVTTAASVVGVLAIADRGETRLAPAPQVAVTPVPLPEVTTPTAEPEPTVPRPTPTATATPAPTPEPTEAEVSRVQQVLADQRYYVGPIDGRAGPATAAAVQAFQKVNGLAADGVIGPATLAALDDPARPSLVGGAADRIEVDLDRQVLYLVRGGEVARILPISSGSGETYRTAGGGTARSLTPVGTFTVERHIRGERHAALGTLYDPMYFYGGWAIHGSNSVPAYPASHGCVRVTRADATWLFDRVPIGMPVLLHGGQHSFDPRAGESAGTTAPAGDTPDTTPDDGLQTEAPQPTPTPTQAPPAPATPTPTASPTPTPTPTAEPDQPAPAPPPVSPADGATSTPTPGATS